MLTTKTVFILGAGASCEAGLPIGSTLRTEIAQMLSFAMSRHSITHGSGNPQIYDILVRQYHAQALLDRLGACKQISLGIRLDGSIDDFIDAHKHDKLITECGKLAIGYAIVAAEEASKLYV